MLSSFRTMEWVDGNLHLLDQTKLPGSEEIVICKTLDDVCESIRTMVVRGAPAIGCAAAFGYVLGIRSLVKDLNVENMLPDSCSSLLTKGREKIYYSLLKTRPTAVNLEWALKQMQSLDYKEHKSMQSYVNAIESKAIYLLNEDINTNLKIGEIGADFLGKCRSVLTHCNAGGLATGGYGTALGVIRSINRRLGDINVFATETRPLLQGARLTAWELTKDDIQVTLITDSMCGALMQTREIDAVIVGADRITANGDVVNKIGTYMVSVLAKENSVPFYVAAPWSTVDLGTLSGRDVEIEQRNINEVRGFGDSVWVQENLNIFNPAFDVTPVEYVSAVITERGVIRGSAGFLEMGRS